LEEELPVAEVVLVEPLVGGVLELDPVRPSDSSAWSTVAITPPPGGAEAPLVDPTSFEEPFAALFDPPICWGFHSSDATEPDTADTLMRLYSGK